LLYISHPPPSTSDTSGLLVINIITAMFMLASAFTSAAVLAQCPLPTIYLWRDSGVLAAHETEETILPDNA
jgi:hypothetical protein